MNRSPLLSRIVNGVLARKVICAVLPRGIRLSRRLADGTFVGGPNRAGHGGRGVFVYGDTLEPELALLNGLLAKDAVVLDVGANSGLYSLKAAGIVGPGGSVISMEPNPQMLAILERNARVNGYSNVRTRGLAAAESCGSFEFYENKNLPNSFSLRSDGRGSPTFSVLAVGVDDLLEWEGVDRLDLVKIDAEGAEDRVLQGAAISVSKYQPVIIAEVTKDGLTELPDGYVALRPTGVRSNNTVLVPQGSPMLHGVLGAGWVEVDAAAWTRGAGDSK